MSLEKKDFYGKEVALAIKNACDALGVTQEKLEIEVIETGTTGIFGLIRKKAHIRVAVKPETEDPNSDVFAVENFRTLETQTVNTREPRQAVTARAENEKKKPEPTSSVQPQTPSFVDDENDEEVNDSDSDKESVDDDEEELAAEKENDTEISPESLETVRSELLQIVELMGFPSTVVIETDGHSVACTLRGEFEENLTGVDGKVLDSLQYILRKIISRKVPERLRISINVGDFREKRLDELKARAVELAAQVKEDGKTQVLPALNPSERRVIHMILQEDNDIRSRSVGEGLFKKILIYKPGKSNRPNNRKRSQSKGRQNKSGSKKGSDS